MKVKVISAERDTYWYANKIGKVLDVRKAVSGYEWLERNSYFLEPHDCVELSTKESLQIDLQAAKNAVAELEKQLAASSAKEITPLHATFMNHSTETLWEYVAAIQKEITRRCIRGNVL